MFTLFTYILMKKEEKVLYASTGLIQSMYGKDALAHLDVADEEEEGSSDCPILIKPVELIELDEIIIGALNKESYEYAQKGIVIKE